MANAGNAYATVNPIKTNIGDVVQGIEQMDFAYREEQRQIDVRHLLNHMVIMRNCFNDNSSDMIAMYCEKFLPLLMPFFDYLGYTPTFFSFEGKTIVTDQIDRDAYMVKTIKELI